MDFYRQIIVLVAVLLLVLFAGTLISPVAQLDRISILGTLALSGTLVFATVAYTRETERIAASTERQLERLHEQITFEYTPNVLLSFQFGQVVEVTNLGRYPVRLEAAGVVREAEARRLLFLDVASQDVVTKPVLMPGESVSLVGTEKDAEAMRWTGREDVVVQFFYGSTSDVLHESQWSLELENGEPVSVSRTSTRRLDATGYAKRHFLDLMSPRSDADG